LFDEQCNSDSAQDVWAIGIIIYKLFFGQYPFNGFLNKAKIKSK